MQRLCGAMFSYLICNLSLSFDDVLYRIYFSRPLPNSCLITLSFSTITALLGIFIIVQYHVHQIQFCMVLKSNDYFRSLVVCHRFCCICSKIATSERSFLSFFTSKFRAILPHKYRGFTSRKIPKS